MSGKKKSINDLIQELNELQAEQQRVRIQGDAYYECAGNPRYPSDAIKDLYAYEQYKLCSRRYNALGKRIQNLKSKIEKQSRGL